MKVFQPDSYDSYIKHQEDRHVSNVYEYDISFWNQSIIDNYSQYLASPILDVGTRNGMLLDKLSEMGFEAKGIELTDIADFAMLQGRDVFKGDIQKMTPYEDKYFKTVIMSHVLEHLYEPDAGLQEVHRILDGHLIVHIPLSAPDRDYLERYGEYVSLDDTDDLCNLITRNGFEIVEIGESNKLNQLVIAKTI